MGKENARLRVRLVTLEDRLRREELLERTALSWGMTQNKGLLRLTMRDWFHVVLEGRINREKTEVMALQLKNDQIEQHLQKLTQKKLANITKVFNQGSFGPCFG